VRPELVVFDLDGTLIDSAADIRRALNLTLAAEGLPGIELDAVRLMIGRGPEVLLRRALGHLKEPSESARVERLTAAFRHHYTEQGHDQTVLLPGATECLQSLTAARISLAVCSNKPTLNCVQVLEDLGVARHFAVIQGSGDGLPLKPDPAPLEAIIDELGASAQRTLYIGDSETDIATARAAAVPVVLVSGGYSAAPAEALQANWNVAGLAEVPSIWETPGAS
jgi:phosphoglycolate phosphatase